jgi:hypothetical protein
VREVWVQWAQRQNNPKPSWLLSYDELSLADQDADDCIGVALWAECLDEFQSELAELVVLRQRLAAAEAKAINELCYGPEAARLTIAAHEQTIAELTARLAAAKALLREAIMREEHGVLTEHRWLGEAKEAVSD